MVWNDQIYQRLREKPKNPNNQIDFQNSDLVERVEQRAVHIRNILAEIHNMIHIFNSSVSNIM